jgi:hypothetical protein
MMRMRLVALGLMAGCLLLQADLARADTPGVVTDNDYDGIDDALEQRLAEKFAPV